MRKARFISLLLVVFLGACSMVTGTEEREVTERSVILRLQVSGEPEEVAVYSALEKAYEDDNPNVEIDVIEVAEKDEHLAKLTTAFAGGRPPELFLVNFREYSQFVARGAVEPIGPLLEEEGFSLDGYAEAPLEAFTYDDVLQCMPQNVSSLVIYANLDLFRAAGVKLPGREPWTWDEFRDAAVTLTSGDVHGLGIEPEIIRVAPFVWSNGGDIVDDLSAPTRFTFDDPAAREALDFIVSLVREDRVVPGEAEVAAQDLETRFVTGKLAMLLSSRRDTPVFREVAGLSWDVAPLPVARERAGILHSDGYCLSAGTDGELQREAARFVAYAVGEQGQTITSLGGRTVPVLEEVARSAAFLDPTQPPRHARVFLDSIPVIRRTPVIPTWPEIEDVATEILTRAFYQEDYTVDDAIRELDEQTRDLFAEGAP